MRMALYNVIRDLLISGLSEMTNWVVLSYYISSIITFRNLNNVLLSKLSFFPPALSLCQMDCLSKCLSICEIILISFPGKIVRS